LRGWYGVKIENDDDRKYMDKMLDFSVNFIYEEVEKGVDYVLDHMKKHGPFDILVGFSQGTIVTHLVAAILRDRGEPMPWKVMAQFCGMRVRDNRYMKMFEQPLQMPVIQVYGTEDPYYEYGFKSQTEMYEKPMIFTHSEGHKFPGPKDKELNRTIADELVKLCYE